MRAVLLWTQEKPQILFLKGDIHIAAKECPRFAVNNYAGNHMNGKDYYQIFGLNEKASEEDIKKAYRRLALKHHPDRNPDDKIGAADRFKEISEAYGVLVDAEKRREYNLFRRVGPQNAFNRGGFRHTREDILKDIFKNPNASDIFGDLGREFEQHGVRFDERFFKEIFFGRGGVFFGGIHYRGPMRTHQKSGSCGPFGNLSGKRRCRVRAGFDGRVTQQRRQPERAEGLLAKLTRKVGKYIADNMVGEKEDHKLSGLARKKVDLHHSLSISAEGAISGTEVTISYKRGKKREKLMVKVPAGTKPGTRLRLKGKGMEGRVGESPGDLFLKINVRDK